MERHFDEELQSLNEKLLRMARLVEESVALAVKSLTDRNGSYAQEVLSRETPINLLDVDVDEECMRLLALRQPMASDNYIVIVGGEPIPQAAEDFFQNPLDLVADDCAADFLGNRHAQPGRFVSSLRDALEIIQDRVPAGH